MMFKFTYEEFGVLKRGNWVKFQLRTQNRVILLFDGMVISVSNNYFEENFELVKFQVGDIIDTPEGLCVVNRINNGWMSYISAVKESSFQGGECSHVSQTWQNSRVIQRCISQ